MSKELVKIIVVDAIAIAAVALLVIFPHAIGGIILCSVVAFCFYASHTRRTKENQGRDRRRFWERTAIGYVAGRVSQGKDII